MAKTSGRGRPGCLRRALSAAVSAVVVAAVALVATPGASAAPGDAQPVLDQKTASVSEAEGGDLITYTITATCSNVGGDDCTGAHFTDPLPKFTDIYGAEVPVEFVSASGTAGIWGDPQFTLDTSDPTSPVVTGDADDWPAGTSTVITITVRVPEGTVPEGTQQLDNTATVTDPVDNPAYSDDSTTASTTISGSTPDWTISKLGPGPDLRLDHEYTWVISVCTTDPASAEFPIYDITDVVPEGFEYISSDPAGTYTDDGTPPDDISGGAGTITWTFDADNPPPLGDDGCFRINVTGEFPSSDPSNTEGAVKTDTVSGDGKVTPDDPGTDIGTDTSTGTIVGPQFGGVSTTKSITDTNGAEDFFVADGDVVRFNLGVTVDSDFPLESVTLDDGTWSFDDGVDTPTSGTGMPESFTATEVNPGTWNDPVTATIQGSDDGTNWSDIATGVASGAAPITLSPTFRSVRWVWDPLLGTLPGNFAATGQSITGTIGEPVDDFGRYTNTSTADVVPDGAPEANTTASDDYVLENPTPNPGIAKTESATQRQPGQPLTYTIVIDNDPDATGDLVNPVVSDCVPASIFVEGTNAPVPWVTGPPLTTCAAGETPISYQYQGTLAPGDSSSSITITTVVRDSDHSPVADFGDYTNTAFVSPDGGGSFAHCQNTNPSCGSSTTVQVLPTVQIDSQKCVSGELDGGVFYPTPQCTDRRAVRVPAETLPAGIIDWRIGLLNVGNTDATDLDFIDILPHVGDTSVITTSNGSLVPRDTEFSPVLITPITAPAGWTISYSTSTNPCRPEVGGVTSGCDDPNWTTTPNLLALGSYRSVKLHFDGVLARGQSGTFTWQMRAAVADDDYDKGGTDPDDPYEFLRHCNATIDASDPSHCPRAVNSFAYGAISTNLPAGAPQIGRLFAEPPEAEVRVVAPPLPNGIGNHVWYDKNFNGIQDADEVGVPGIPVALWTTDGTLIADTFTDSNGDYGFNSEGLGVPIPDGDYVVRLYQLAGWFVSPRDVTGGPTDEGAPGGTSPGTNTDDDSDFPQTVTGTDQFGPYYQSAPIHLGDNPNNPPGSLTPIGEIDPTWDAGLWRAEPAVDIVKVTKDTAWDDSAAGDGVLIVPGRPIEWQYTITNAGNSRLENMTIGDDGGPDLGFAVTDCTIVDDGENSSGVSSSATVPFALNRGAVMTCTATGTAGTVDYANNATVSGTPVLDDRTPVTAVPAGFPPLQNPVTDTDPSSYRVAIYDLALAKTVGTPDLATGDVTFTVTVRNQGTLPSGGYTVTDSLTPSLSVTATSPTASTTTGDPTSGVGLTWDLGGLDPGQDQTITINAHIDDYLIRPFRNLAEISDDSADLVRTGNDVLTPTADVDSTPDVIPDNDGDYGPVGSPTAIDNSSIDQAGVGPDAPPNGEDDADIADLVPDIHYDLALAKVADASPIGLGVNPSFTVRVYNQGNVPSGEFTVLDQLPTGLSFDAGSSSPECAATVLNRVRCTTANLQPGAFATYTIATTIDGTPDDYSTAPWQNWAEIDTDSAQALYAVDDVDSTPEAVENNGIGSDATPPGDPFLDVTSAGDTYADPGQGDADDNDSAIVESSVRYDLALTKTAAATPVTQTADATITYTITVQNQGTVPSGSYQVTDVVPPGVSVDDAGGGSTTANGDGSTTVVWSGSNLAPGETTTLTLATTVTDLTKRPYRNEAEISQDSATALYGITDIDSAPDSDPTNDGDYGPIGSPSAIDNLDITQAGVGPDAPPNGEDDADIADVTFPLTYDLALSKVASADIVEPEDVITYTITVQNQGVLDSHAYTVTDQIPAGLAVVPGSVSDGGTVGGSTISWNLDALAPAASRNLTFNATVSDLTQRPFRNQAEISADGADTWSVPGDTITDVDSTPDADPTNDGDYGPVGSPSAIDNHAITDAGVGPDAPPNGEDDADIADVDVDVRYDLALVKTGPATIQPWSAGGANPTAQFTVTVQNQGNVDSRAYSVQDDVPAGMVATAASNGGTIGLLGRVVTWTNLPSLAPGETATLTVDVEVTDLNQRPWTNFAEITADSSDSYSAATEPVTDIDSTPGDIATNDVDDTSIDQAGQGADAGFDDEDIAVVTTNIVYDLALVKTVDKVVIAPDDTSTFTITVQNQGNVPSRAFTVSDKVPAGLAVVEGSVSNGGTAGPLTPLSAFSSLPPGGSQVQWADLASLDPGASVELTFQVTISDIDERPYANFAEITADSADTYTSVAQPTPLVAAGVVAAAAAEVVRDVDSVPDDPETTLVNNTSIAEAGQGADAGFDDEDIAVILGPVDYDLALVKTVDDATTAYNGTPTFTITVQNQGNVPSLAYTVTDNIPTGLEVVDGSVSDGGVVSADGTQIVWTDLPSIDPEATHALTFNVSIADITTRPWMNFAEITADSAASYTSTFPLAPTVDDVDSTPGDEATSNVDNTSIDQAGLGDDAGFDDEDVAPLDTVVTYDLAIDKRLLADQTYKEGDVVSYEVEVTNQGNVPSGTYSFADTIPPGMSFDSASDGGTANGQVVTWTDMASLAPSASKTVTVRARLDDVTLDSYRNWVQITADSSAGYSTAGQSVKDSDSTPNNGELGEDDDDFAIIPVADVQADNAVAPPASGKLSATGGDIGIMLRLAVLLVVVGGLLMSFRTWSGRRRPRAPRPS